MRWLNLLLIFITASCTRVPQGGESIARVNGRNISVQEFKEAFSYLKPTEITLSGVERAETKNLVLKSLVRRAVILTAAENAKITLTPKEVEDGIKKFKAGYTSTSFEQSLLDQMVDAEEWKNRVRQNLLIEKLFQSSAPKVSAPSNREAIQYYEEHPNLFRKEAESEALHIVVADSKLADELRQKIKAAPKTFQALAKQYSTGPEAQDDAIIRVTQNTLPEDLDHALFNLKVGELSPVIASSYGFHLIRVLDRTPALNLDFVQVRDDIMKSLVEQHRQKWLLDFEENLIRSAQVEYNRELIKQL